MDSLLFKLFVKEAMAIQVEDDYTPPDYIMVKAAVESKFPMLKEAVSEEWVKRLTRSGLRNASDERIDGFIRRMQDSKDKNLSFNGPEARRRGRNYTVATDEAFNQKSRRLLNMPVPDIFTEPPPAIGAPLPIQMPPLPGHSAEEHAHNIVDGMHRIRERFAIGAPLPIQMPPLPGHSAEEHAHNIVDGMHRIRERFEDIPSASARISRAMENVDLVSNADIASLNRNFQTPVTPRPPNISIGKSVGKLLGAGALVGLGSYGIARHFMNKKKQKTKTANMDYDPKGSKWSNFRSGAKQEVGPAIGATLGAGVANMYGISPVAGAAAGYGLGSIHELVHGIRNRAR